MSEYVTDVLTGLGLLLTLIGASMTARSVILKPKEAIHIGVARYSSGNSYDDLMLPSVQNLLASSKGARNGLILIAFGTFLQLVPIGARLVFS